MKEVAATYEKWERVGSPFFEDEKYYITVINPKTGKEKVVRWYGEVRPDYKHLLGFDNGYITVFEGINKDNHEFFKESNARYAWFFGWYVVSTESVPDALPTGVVAHTLEWDDSFVDAAKRLAATKKIIGEIYDE